MEHLSDIELYFSQPQLINNSKIILEDDEFHHAVNVMRNSVGDFIYITDGTGNLFKSKITEISKNNLVADILESTEFENKAVKIFFCLPVLKNSDRMKFAIEKSVELGITNFILFSSKRTVPQKINKEKFQKTAIAAMKQSLRTFLPKIDSASLEDIIRFEGDKILFHQHSKKIFNGEINSDKFIYFIFGPEGGFEESEIKSVPSEKRFFLSTNRLRSETAIIKCASLISSF